MGKDLMFQLGTWGFAGFCLGHPDWIEDDLLIFASAVSPSEGLGASESA